MKGMIRTQGGEKKQDKVKPFTQGLQITNDGAIMKSEPDLKCLLSL